MHYEDFEIDFIGGSHGKSLENVKGHHEIPVDINYDWEVNNLFAIPRSKWDGLENGVRVTVLRRTDIRAEGIFALKIADPDQRLNLLMPAGSIVSRIIHPQRAQEMIWYRSRGELKSIIVDCHKVLERYDRRVGFFP